tara:strand:- start:331 stop:588 length:258 start_codon:yes stop_codon:yes gene_type:complete
MSSSEKKSDSKPSMIVDIYKKYKRKKQFEKEQPWEDEYFYIYGIESDEELMERLALAGKVAYVTAWTVPVLATIATAALVKYLFF